jgi:hypothetical protein
MIIIMGYLKRQLSLQDKLKMHHPVISRYYPLKTRLIGE